MHIAVAYLRPLETDVCFENCVTQSLHSPFCCSEVITQRLKFNGNRSEQLYSVQPLPTITKLYNCFG